MKTIVVRFTTLAAEADAWWATKSPEFKARYIAKHPQSRYAKQAAVHSGKNVTTRKGKKSVTIVNDPKDQASLLKVLNVQPKKSKKGSVADKLPPEGFLKRMKSPEVKKKSKGGPNLGRPGDDSVTAPKNKKSLAYPPVKKARGEGAKIGHTQNCNNPKCRGNCDKNKIADVTTQKGNKRTTIVNDAASQALMLKMLNADSKKAPKVVAPSKAVPKQKVAPGTKEVDVRSAAKKLVVKVSGKKADKAPAATIKEKAPKSPKVRKLVPNRDEREHLDVMRGRAKEAKKAENTPAAKLEKLKASIKNTPRSGMRALMAEITKLEKKMGIRLR